MLSFATLGGLLALYWLSLAVYRLYFSPLSRIPGPKIAALTSWYCVYHDVWRDGQYIWVIEAMHRQYGPVVRIMPDVVHVNHPSFVEKLYTQSPNLRRERAQTILNLFHTHKSVLPTRDHNLHRRRRAALSPFFSQQNVRRLVPVINDTLGDLLQRFDGWAKADSPVRLNWAYRAATKDVIQFYALGEGTKCLRMDDCNAAFFGAMDTGRRVHVSVHFHWLANFAINCLPPWLMMWLDPQIVVFAQFLEGLAAKIENIRGAKDRPERRTIFDEILRSNMPEEEKETPRLVDEAMVLAIAGSDTTASTMVALSYHILSDPTIFSRLREELESVIPNPDQAPDPVKLDGLPFLNALIEEALRLYPATTFRQDRVAPDHDLIFEYEDGRTVTIPKGTMVGMTAPLLNRHEGWYSDPDTFNPDRYLEDPKLFRRHLTFSKGGRQCLGINLAYQELQTFIAGIFRKYSPYNPSLKHQSGPTLELYQTRIEDIQLYADHVTPGLYPGSQGMRVRVRGS